MKRVMIGDVRIAHGCVWTVIAKSRGRRGEARTMVVVERWGSDGSHHCETRALATVAEWQRADADV